MIRYIKQSKNILVLCDTLTDRDGIADLADGMFSYVLAETKTYQLQGGSWVEFGAGGSANEMFIIRTETDGLVNLSADEPYGQTYIFVNQLSDTLSIRCPNVVSYGGTRKLNFYFVNMDGYEANLYDDYNTNCATFYYAGSLCSLSSTSGNPSWVNDEITIYDGFSNEIEKEISHKFNAKIRFTRSTSYAAINIGSTSYTLDDNIRTINCTSGSATTINLPQPWQVPGREYVIKRSLGSVTIQCVGYLIDSSSTLNLNGAIYDCVTVQSNGSKWLITDRYMPIMASTNSILYQDSVGAITGSSEYLYDATTRTVKEYSTWTGMTLNQIRNDNDTSNTACAVFEVKGSGADYTNNVYFGKYGNAYWIPEFAGRGAIASDKGIAFATPDSSKTLDFYVGTAYATLSKKFSVASSANTSYVLLNYNSDLSSSYTDRTLTDKQYVDSGSFTTATGSVTTYNPSASTRDHIILCNTAAPVSVVISTEDVNSGSATRMREFKVIDYTGNAGNQPITITLENGGTINGVASVQITGNYNALTVLLDGTNGVIL